MVRARLNNGKLQSEKRGSAKSPRQIYYGSQSENNASYRVIIHNYLKITQENIIIDSCLSILWPVLESWD